MIFLCIMMVVFYGFLIKSEVPYLALFKKSKVSTMRLYFKQTRYFNLKFQVLMVVLMSAVILLVGLLFYLPWSYIIMLLVFVLCCYPVFLLWVLSHQYYGAEFEQLTAFLQHFLAHFKTNQKVLLSLVESQQYVSGKLLTLVQDAIAALETHGDAGQALNGIVAAYPHFIVHNVQSWITAAEVHGVADCKEAFELLEDDIDDWIEDTHLNMMTLHQTKSKVLVLAGVALLIALFNQVMLGGVLDLEVNTLYNQVMFMFLLMELTTVLMVYRYLKGSWIIKGECLWKKSS